MKQDFKEILIIAKMLICTLVIFIFGCIGFGVHECGKIMLDKIKKG